MLATILTKSYPFFEPRCDEHHLWQMIGVYGVTTVMNTAKALYRNINIDNLESEFVRKITENNSKCNGKLSTMVKLRRKCLENHTSSNQLPIGSTPHIDEQMLDFLDQTTLFQFWRRLKSQQALKHPFLHINNSSNNEKNK